MKPIWLLDVDGVVNACPYCPPGTEYPAPFPRIWPEDSWHFDWIEAAGRKWPIHWNQSVVDFINRVHDAELAEIRWHTTWRSEALNLAERTGLNVRAVQGVEHYTFQRLSGLGVEGIYPYWWKMQAAIEVLTVEKRPLIWTDDDLGIHLRTDFRQLFVEEAQKDPTLVSPGFHLVTPFTETGLRQEELDSIDDFIEKIADSPQNVTSGSDALVG